MYPYNPPILETSEFYTCNTRHLFAMERADRDKANEDGEGGGDGDDEDDEVYLFSPH